MNLLQEILSAQDGGVVGQLAQQFGIDAGDASKALSNLIPAIAGGIKKTAKTRWAGRFARKSFGRQSSSSLTGQWLRVSTRL